jgi:hypothetical protein
MVLKFLRCLTRFSGSAGADEALAGPNPGLEPWDRPAQAGNSLPSAGVKLAF